MSCCTSISTYSEKNAKKQELTGSIVKTFSCHNHKFLQSFMSSPFHQAEDTKNLHSKTFHLIDKDINYRKYQGNVSHNLSELFNQTNLPDFVAKVEGIRNQIKRVIVNMDDIAKTSSVF